MLRGSSKQSSSSSLGTLWSAKSTVDAWCSSQKPLKSLDLASPPRLRLQICNDSTLDLVYTWITPEGKVQGWKPLPPRQRKKEEGKNAVVAAQDKAPLPHIERTFVGHAFVFGHRLPDDNTAPQELTKDLTNVVVLGGYRSERVSKGKEAPDFPCHILTLEPPTPQMSSSTMFASSFLSKLMPCCPTMPLEDDEEEAEAPPQRLRRRKRPPEVSPPDASAEEEEWLHFDDSWRLSFREQTLAEDQSYLDTTVTHHYRAATLCGDWPVQLQTNKKCFATDEEEATFCRDLQHALNCLPSHARQRLRQVPCQLWLNASFAYGPEASPEVCDGLCFHPGVAWLEDSKMHTNKCHCIEVYNVSRYCEHDRHYWGPGGVLLHELSHAYHHRCLTDGYDNAEIVECYQRAMQEGLYDKVAVHESKPAASGEWRHHANRKAYACTNAMEYFAELSTAFLGGTDPDKEYNKWFPFNRAQLQQHDPRAYALLQKLWYPPDTDATEEEKANDVVD